MVMNMKKPGKNLNNACETILLEKVVSFMRVNEFQKVRKYILYLLLNGFKDENLLLHFTGRTAIVVMRPDKG